MAISKYVRNFGPKEIPVGPKRPDLKFHTILVYPKGVRNSLKSRLIPLLESENEDPSFWILFGASVPSSRVHSEMSNHLNFIVIFRMCSQYLNSINISVYSSLFM